MDLDQRATSGTEPAETAAPAESPEVSSPPARSSEGSPPAEREPAEPSTDRAEQPAPDPKAFWKGLTPEQKREVLREDDPDALVSLDDRLSGKVGRLAQQQAQRLLEQWQAQQETVADLERRQRALQERDPDAALEIVESDLRRRQQALTSEQQQRLAPWSGAVALFTSGLLPEDVVKPLAGKQYGDDPEAAAKTFYKDIEAGYEKHFRAKLAAEIRKDLEPVIRKELMAELNGGEPSPDLGSGSPPRGDGFSWRSLGEARAAVDRMSPAEYARNAEKIDAALFRLAQQARRGGGRAA